jgi:hypothetical protein
MSHRLRFLHAESILARVCRIALVAVGCALFATEPNDATRRWWAHVVALGGDDMEGRETGSEGYRKAARYVAAQFEKNGVKPAGEHGYYQTVPLHWMISGPFSR